MFQRQPWLYIMLAAELSRLRVTQVVPALNARRGYREQLRLEEAITEGAASITDEGPGMEGS